MCVHYIYNIFEYRVDLILDSLRAMQSPPQRIMSTLAKAAEEIVMIKLMSPACHSYAAI